MDWGMQNRLSRVFGADGRCFFLPIDHGYFQGPTRCLEKPGETIKPTFSNFDEDQVLDSAVLIDNFQWNLTPALQPTTGPE